MRTSTLNLVAILTVGIAVAAANSASAGGFSFGGGHGSGGFKVSFGGGNHNHHNNHHGHHNFHHYPVKKYYTPVYVYDQCYHPYYSYCFVYPGDTWYTIARRCYGHSHLWKHIALYNNLSLSSSVLVPGRQLQLPVVNANGTLAASNAPAPAPLAPQGMQLGPQAQSFAPQGLPTGLNAGSPAPQQAMTSPIGNAAAAANVQPVEASAPAANIRSIAHEPQRPMVSIGSTLALDGESLGGEKGIVRLRISGMSLPVDVLEWSGSSVKIKLPAIDLSEAIDADLEVLRADGSLASKSAIKLTPAATRLALEN